MADKDFLESLMTMDAQLPAGLGPHGFTAYEGEDEVLPPDEVVPTAEEEALFLGDLPVVSGPEELSGLEQPGATPPRRDLESCGTMDMEDLEIALLLGDGKDIAPLPLSNEYVFHKPTAACGDLHNLYLAYQKLLTDKAEVVQFEMNRQTFNLTKGAFGMASVTDKRGKILYGSEVNPTRNYNQLKETDILIWVTRLDSDEVLGYILNGWSYLTKK